MDEHLADQVASLLESTAALHRTLAQVVSQLPANPKHLPNLSDLNLTTPASAQASILAPGMGMEDMDNFTTEVGTASRLNCSNMAISATLVSAIVATFMSETYSNTETVHMRVVNGLWFLSLFLSLATATLCMLVSEWLTWTTSQELRDISVLYRLIRTAFRSLFMHLSIFLFFAGLLVLMWNESTMDVCVVPSVAVGLFSVYYVSATVRSPLFALLFDIKQFDDNDFRGLRVQIWTPFTLGTHHLVNYIFIFVISPIRKLMRRWHTPNPEVLAPSFHRPELRGDLPDSEKTVTLALETANLNMGLNASQTLSPIARDRSLLRHHGSSQIRQRGPSPLRGRSPLSVRSQPPSPAPPGVESPQTISRVGTPLSLNAGDLADPEIEHQRKLRATRQRRLAEHEILRPVRSVTTRAGNA
ncbi:unnamed protein product [Rhizoctonia solani]|uniref:DUF6535 domain-containing protein n=1 Tax=Rhizoctonia solani TaxID=456999 RepID=A0A8H3HY67_9AGAM|nr:unnamed protein product [Rhizoctonia solani]